EKGPLTFASLYKLIYGYTKYGPSQINILTQTLRTLYSIGLIQSTAGEDWSHFMEQVRYFRHLERVEEDDQVTIQVTPLVDHLQSAFGISVTDYASGKGEQITVDPVFGQPRTWTKDAWPAISVLMPFASELRPIYDDHIAT